MDDHPATPDSGNTVRASALASHQPLRKTRLYELGEQKPTHSRSSSLNPTASPFRPDTLGSDAPGGYQVTQSFSGDDYPSQRFRPAPGDHTGPDGAFDSPSRTFLPPESPDMGSVGGVGLEPGDGDHQTPQHPSTKPYAGVNVAPGQLSNLTTYGILSHATQPSAASGDTWGSSSGDDLGNTQFTPSSTHEDDTLRTGQANRHKTPGKNGSLDIAPQTKTFAQLAREKGLRPWDNTAFDDRWLLQSDELGTSHKVGSSFSRAQDKDSDDPFSDGTFNIGKTEPFPSFYEPLSHPSKPPAATGRTLKPSADQQMIDMRHRSQDRAENIFSSSAKKIAAKIEEPGLVPPPPEAERLSALIHDVETGKGLTGIPFSRRIVRTYLYERCFGKGDRPDPLSDTEARLVTVWDGRRVTLGELRDDIVDMIENIIHYLKTPSGKSLLEGEDAADEGDPSLHLSRENQRAKAYKITNRLRPDDDSASRQGVSLLDTYPQSASHVSYGDGQIEPSSKRNKIYTNLQSLMGQRQDLNRAQANQESDLTNEFGRFKLQQINEESPSRSSTGARTAVNTFPDEERYQSAHYRPGSHFDGSSSNATSQSIHESPSHGAWGSSTYSSVPQSPFTSPEKPGYGGYPQQQLWPPTPNANFTPGQLQYMAHQQMQFGGALNMGSQYGQQQPMGFRQSQPMMSGGMHGPNGIWVPNDRYVRPPAANRMAPYAWAGNPNPVRQSPTVAQHPEWQNRFGTPSPGIARDNRKLAYVEGSDEMCPQARGGASVRYQNVTRSNPPGLHAVIDDVNLPFSETARGSKADEWGVMRIGNIPYEISKTAIISFLGNHAKLITPELGPSVHIIMDRATGKTQDCYVEFFSTPDAAAWVNVINSRTNAANRIGDRVLDAQLSSQSELLQELFPRAKNVTWKTGQPVVTDPEEPYNSGFKQFISAEELQVLVRHAEQPHRSSYTLKCPNRPYEAMVSLLSKFPWQATQLYTISTRNKIFDAALKMVHLLSINLRRSPTSLNPSMENSPIGMYGPFSNYGTPSASGYNTPASVYGGMPPRAIGVAKPINPALLRDLLSAALNAPGFSEKQRWELHQKADPANSRFAVSPLAQWWPFEALGRKRGYEEDLVEWYARLLASHETVDSDNSGSPFGNLTEMLRGISDSATMEDVGEMEWRALCNILMDQCNN